MDLLTRCAEDDAYGASHTSFYTDAVAKDKYDTLEEALLNACDMFAHQHSPELAIHRNSLSQ
eukprot:4153437-Amphidinium_carterae.1